MKLTCFLLLISFFTFATQATDKQDQARVCAESTGRSLTMQDVLSSRDMTKFAIGQPLIIVADGSTMTTRLISQAIHHLRTLRAPYHAVQLSSSRRVEVLGYQFLVPFIGPQKGLRSTVSTRTLQMPIHRATSFDKVINDLREVKDLPRGTVLLFDYLWQPPFEHDAKIQLLQTFLTELEALLQRFEHRNVSAFVALGSPEVDKLKQGGWQGTFVSTLLQGSN